MNDIDNILHKLITKPKISIRELVTDAYNTGHKAGIENACVHIPLPIIFYPKGWTTEMQNVQELLQEIHSKLDKLK